MRKLAILAFSFSAAVFAASYLLPEVMLLSVGLVLLAVGVAAEWLRRKAHRRMLALVLVLFGLAAGLLWAHTYSAMFFRPAQELDDRTVRLTGTVSEWPQETDYGYSVLIRADTGSLVDVNMILYTDEQGAGLRPGDRIASVVHCTLGDRTFAGEEITYYVAKGIFLRGVVYGRLDVERPDRVPLRYWAAVLSKELKAGIDTAFSGEEAALIRALVTGNRDNLTDEFTTSLQRTGLSHTVAVSGMHLAFLSSLLSLLLGKGKRSTAILTVVWVVVFCGVAGNTPSVLRAAVMILMLQIAPLFERERDAVTSLAVALMLLLAWNPYSATHIGLQLSFGAVAGILLASDKIQNWMLKKLRLDKRPKHALLRLGVKILRFPVSILSATLGSSVLTIPLVALYFNSFSLVSPISNLLALWAVAILFVAGLTVGAVGIFAPGAAAVLAIPFTYLARYLMWVVEALGRIPLASIALDSVYYRMWVLFLCLLILLVFLAKGKLRLWIPASAGVLTFGVSVLLTVMTFQSGELAAAVLDVGQGQSVLLRSGNYLTLVDCGGDRYENAGDVAADYIQSLGRSGIDLLVISHYHADHANGIPQLLKRIDVSAIAMPDVEQGDPLREKIMEMARGRQIEVWLIREDTRIALGSEQEFVLYAPLGEGMDTNELGLTVLASAGDFDVLLTGDMGGEVEQLLLEHADLPDVELMVVGHHGSAYSTTAHLLDAIQPDTAVISVGADNRYGHPAQSTLERLDAVGAEIYRTDLQGTVVVRSRDMEET